MAGHPIEQVPVVDRSGVGYGGFPFLLVVDGSGEEDGLEDAIPLDRRPE